MKFKLCNINVEISYLFVFALTLFIAVDKTNQLMFLFISVLLHETAHIFTILILGAKIENIKFDFGIINVNYNKVFSCIENVLILLSGPFINLILYLIFFKYTDFASINLALFIINLLFVDGLDGGEILRIILTLFITKKSAEIILNIMGFLCSVSFFIIFIIVYLNGVHNLSLLFFSVYLLFNVLIKFR